MTLVWLYAVRALFCPYGAGTSGQVSVGLGLLAALLTYGCVIGIKRFVMWISNKEWRNAKIHKSKILA